MPKRVVIAGGSGLIGSALVEALRQRGDEVLVLRRSGRSPVDLTWDPSSGVLEPTVLDGADAVVCLNGAGIGDKRWNPQRKEELRSSRIGPVSLLATTMAAMTDAPAVFVTGSATGCYGDTGDELVDESSPHGDDFLAQLCVDWEAAAKPAADAGIRVAHARTGIVLSNKAGALSPLLPIFRAGLGGPISSGKQWWSWITLRDEVAALVLLIDEDVAGPVNLVAPNPVHQREFATALGSVLHRPAVVAAPKFAVNVRLGKELAEAIGYASQRVAPTVLDRVGFEFADTEVTEALASVLGSRGEG
jgi:uncharacterized protein